METPVIKFKYLKNRQIHLGDGVMYLIPYRMGPKLINGVPDPACETGVPHFNMDFVHEVTIYEEVPQLPEREDYMDDEMYREVCKDGFEEARENRKKNATVRKALKHYAADGTIEIVDDPFAGQKRVSAKELAARATQKFGSSLKTGAASEGGPRTGIEVPADGVERTATLTSSPSEQPSEEDELEDE